MSSDKAREPVAYMRRHAFDGVDVMKMPKTERPRGWGHHDVSTSKLFPEDVPLYAALSQPAPVREAVEALEPFAKAGELFPDPAPEFDQCIYSPAAGDEYSLSGNDLRRARKALASLRERPTDGGGHG
jgi:hypothetical protein